jgi:hypothetical protein
MLSVQRGLRVVARAAVERQVRPAPTSVVGARFFGKDGGSGDDDEVGGGIKGTVHKTDLIQMVAIDSGQTQHIVGKVLNSALKKIMDTLAAEDK